MVEKRTVRWSLLAIVTCLVIGVCGCGKSEAAGEIAKTKIAIESDEGNEKGIYFYRDDLKIYGKLFLPEGEGPFPVVICSSPMGASLSYSLDVIKDLNKNGIVKEPKVHRQIISDMTALPIPVFLASFLTARKDISMAGYECLFLNTSSKNSSTSLQILWS